MDRPTKAIERLSTSLLNVELNTTECAQLRNWLSHLEQELTVRDELLNSIYLDMTQLGEVLPMGETTFNKLRDFIKQRNEQG